jgi:hypothetical protein
MLVLVVQVMTNVVLVADVSFPSAYSTFLSYCNIVRSAAFLLSSLTLLVLLF